MTMPTPTDAGIDVAELLSRPWRSWTGMTGEEFTEATIDRLELESLCAALTAARAEVAVLMDAAAEHWENCDQNTPDCYGNYVDDEDRCPICDLFEAKRTPPTAADADGGTT